MRLNVIACVDPNGVIGKDGTLPWAHLKEDMAYFREQTCRGQRPAVVMGRKTWDSLPKAHKPLAGRVNIVVSNTLKQAEQPTADVAIVPSFDDAYFKALRLGCDSLWVIGGGQLYRSVFQNNDYMIYEIHITHLKVKVEEGGGGEITFFPMYVLGQKPMFEVSLVAQHQMFEIKVYKLAWT